MNYSPNMPVSIPFTPMVKRLMIANVAIWLVLQVIVEQFFLPGRWVTLYGGLLPLATFDKFFLWQPFTYMFLHSMSVTHILFNMLMLWMTGSELEGRWGSRFFLGYYLVCGVGAALLYLAVIIGYGLITGNPKGWTSPVIGASGAIFGLLVAYGMIFGERIVYFMMIFPMKAKYFVMILGAILMVTMINEGLVGGDVAHLAHLGGLVTGFVFLKFWTWTEQRRWKNRTSRTQNQRRLRLIVNNDERRDDPNGPRYWN
jgi:membrane associated rhomboid family serine protease